MAVKATVHPRTDPVIIETFNYGLNRLKSELIENLHFSLPLEQQHDLDQITISGSIQIKPIVTSTRNIRFFTLSAMVSSISILVDTIWLGPGTPSSSMRNGSTTPL